MLPRTAALRGSDGRRVWRYLTLSMRLGNVAAFWLGT